MNRFQSEQGSQAFLGIGLLALNLALMLVVLGSSSLLIQQRALNAFSDAYALSLADWLRVNRDNPELYPTTWSAVVDSEFTQLNSATTLSQLSVIELVGLDLVADRSVTVRVCSKSWLDLGRIVQVCTSSTATQQ